MNRTDIRLIALDLDGTLMDSDKRFPEINCRDLQKCERAGIHVCLVSGRSFELMRGFARELGIRPMFAASNGARIEQGIDGPKIEEHSFDVASAQRVLDTLERSGLYFNYYTRGRCYMGNAEMKAALGARYDHHVPGIVGDAPYTYETICDRERLHTDIARGVYKFVAMGDPYDARFEGLRRTLADMNLSVSSASTRNIEFMPTGVDKAYALRTLCTAAGMEPDHVMAFGDQTNDLPMLDICAWPVAMANGEDIVKRRARIIAPDHNIGGVGLTIQKYILGDENI